MRNVTPLITLLICVFTLQTQGMRYTVKDDLYRLTGETRTGTNAYTIDYTYDNVGNRLTQIKDGNITIYSYNNRDQLITEDSAGVITTYTYDHAGRQTSKTQTGATTNYSWIDNDRMASVNGPGVNAAYVYDSEGRRISESANGTEKNYLIDNLLPYGQVIAETDNSGNLVASYIYGLERISMNRGAAIFNYLADGQGSVRQLANESGTITDSWTYTAFGEIIARTGTTENQFTYTGEQWDPNAGFYYLRARWYNPTNGRLVSVDPWEGDPQAPVSLHRYLYGNASPINFVDPTGRWSLVEAITTSYVQANNAIRAVVVYTGTTFYAGRALLRISVASLKSWLSGEALMPEVQRAADAMYPKLANMGMQAHHVIPKYIARAFNLPIDETVVSLPASVHQYFTNAIAQTFLLKNPTLNVSTLPQAMRELMKAYDLAIKNLLSSL